MAFSTTACSITSSSEKPAAVYVPRGQATLTFDSKRTWGPKPNYPKVLEYQVRPLEFASDAVSGLGVIAGPCSIESPEQAEVIASEIKRCGVSWMRGGVFRAGTYPPPSMGLQRNLLERWAGLAHFLGLKIVVEVLDLREVEYIDQFADAFQVGARHMQDYALLRELAQSQKPVTLKRHHGSKLDEFMGAAEYLCNGNCKPILIERGSASHLDHVRWEMSVSTVAAIKRLTKLPVLVDASHGSGRRDLVEPLTLAGIAAGADGFLIEVHPEPVHSLSDADQAYPLAGFEALLKRARAVKEALA